ncbi:MAG: hypothetical protein KDJ31_02085 [Candidatus Competibacteraceae bacterium]|nr:hypothetical protein [Candidatus Competibacteraceae bacterium]HRY14318.1 hypothetical protein [Candidatus Competibacteraceae bacterium]
MSPAIGILDVAREILPVLPKLLGEDAEAVEQSLTRLLERARSGEAVDHEIRVLLGKYPATDRWKRDRLRGNDADGVDEKSYQPLPGQRNTPRAVKYACPVSGCNTPPWFPIDAGDVIPSCEIHGVPFESVSND